MKPEAPLIYTIGDSISVHYGESLQTFLGDHFRVLRRSGDQRALANLDIPAGANSGDSAGVLGFLQARMDAGDFKPDLLLVNCGLHDIKRPAPDSSAQVTLPDYRRNLFRIVERVRFHGVSMAWVRTTPCVDFVHNERHFPGFFRYAADCADYNRVADSVMKSAGIPLIDLHHFTLRLGSADELFCDHVHFHPEIRRLQAAFLAGWILSRWERTPFFAD